jgi:hypothetical protein
MLNQQQYQRRTFRGRGGPTDRRLPKYNAARRRPAPPTPDEPAAEIPSFDENSEEGLTEEEQACFGENSCVLIIEPDATSGLENAPHIEEIGRLETPATPFTNEIDHLVRRIRNNRTSMSLSAKTLVNSTPYQTNVLAACLNTIREWRSILRFHGEGMDEATTKFTGSLIFDLIQQSLQCGPLAGAKPGYFKRCGSEVAAIVHKYLQEAVNDADDAINTLCFTKTQANAIDTWKVNSQKAASSSKPISKSVLKKRDMAKKKKG